MLQILRHLWSLCPAAAVEQEQHLGAGAAALPGPGLEQEELEERSCQPQMFHMLLQVSQRGAVDHQWRLGGQWG